MITESKFADDAALYASSHKDFEMVASSFVAVAKMWGLTVNLVKSKGMVVGNGADALGLSPVPAGGGFSDLVEDFQYLGSCISRDGKLSM